MTRHEYPGAFDEIIDEPKPGKRMKPKRTAEWHPAFSDEVLALRFAERHAKDLRYVAA